MDSSCRGENGIKHKPAAEMARMVGQRGSGWWQVLGPPASTHTVAGETLVQAEGGDPTMSNTSLASETSAA